MSLMALLLITFGRPYSPKQLRGGGGYFMLSFGHRPNIFGQDCRLYHFNANNTLPELRLVGGRWSGEGRVEIFEDRAWGTVCDDGWDMNDAQVVCRALGYPSAITAPTHARFGKGTGEILLDNVDCKGDEPSIERCSHSGWNEHNCGHHEDASVICSSKYDYVVFLFLPAMLNYNNRLRPPQILVSHNCRCSSQNHLLISG